MYSNPNTFSIFTDNGDFDVYNPIYVKHIRKNLRKNGYCHCFVNTLGIQSYLLTIRAIDKHSFHLHLEFQYGDTTRVPEDFIGKEFEATFTRSLQKDHYGE